MMNRLIESIRGHKFLWLTVAILLTVIPGYFLRQADKCLKTPRAPKAIVSLELAFDKPSFDAIYQEWNQTVCDGGKSATSIARVSIIEDMFFLVGYSLFLCICVVLVYHRRLSDFIFQHAALAPLVAGLLDGIENVFMYLALSDMNIHPLLFGVPAAIKFGLIVLVVVYLLYALLGRLWWRDSPSPIH